MGSLEAGMQLVYERESCNITLHRDLSGPSQRAIVFPPSQPSSLFSLGKLLHFSFLSLWNGHGVGDTGTQNTETEPHLSLSTLPKGVWKPRQGADFGDDVSLFLPLPSCSLKFFLPSLELRFRDGISHPRERINICGEVEVKQWCRERQEGITRSSSR